MLRPFSRAIRLLLVPLILVSAARAHADEAETAATYAVQKRQYRLGHELNAAIGVLPLNAFTKGLTVGGGYTYHFSDNFAWEVAEVMYSFGVNTSLKNQLLKDFQVTPTQIESINYLGSSSFVVKPWYGKFAFFNKYTLHTEIYALLGAAFGKYINPSVFRGGFDVGVGLRFYAQKYTSIRFDIRDYVFFKNASPQNELYISLSLALAFGK